MKKVMLLLAILFAGATYVSSQNADLQKWANKDDVYNDVKKSTKSTKVSNVIKDTGFYLEKSANYQYGAISCAGVGAALAITGAIIGTTDYSEVENRLDKGESDRKTRRGLFIGSGISFAAAICCEFAAINYKLKAGQSLRMFSNGTGGGLAYTF